MQLLFLQKITECFHILSPTTKDFYENKTRKYGNVPFRAMLFCDVAGEPLLFDTLDNLTLITQSKIEVMTISTAKCLKTNLACSVLGKLNVYIKSCSQKKK